jgi:hypothetical protein
MNYDNIRKRLQKRKRKKEARQEKFQRDFFAGISADGMDLVDDVIDGNNPELFIREIGKEPRQIMWDVSDEDIDLLRDNRATLLVRRQGHTMRSFSLHELFAVVDAVEKFREDVRATAESMVAQGKLEKVGDDQYRMPKKAWLEERRKRNMPNN